jgi:hypothetical protein
MKPSMPLLSLEYPNGRTAQVELDDDVKPGQEFDMYGRRWKVVGRAARAKGRYGNFAGEPPLLCRQIGR